jgi:nitrile hydratase
VRTPHYVRGKVGLIESYLGDFPSPEELAYGQDGLPTRRLYTVKFQQDELWHEYGDSPDFVLVDIYENWLKEVQP